MTIDLKAPEVVAAIEAAVEAALTPIKAKNTELIGEVRELRKGKTIDPAELERRDAKIEELQTQLTDANKSAKDAKTAAEKATKTLTTEQAFTQKLLVDNGLTAELVKAGVKEPAHLKAVKAMLAGQVQIVVDGENRTAKVGDKALDAFVGEWAKSDEGKFFVSAPNNNGGGAQGGNGNGSGKTISQTAFNQLKPADRAKRMAEGYTLTES